MTITTAYSSYRDIGTVELCMRHFKALKHVLDLTAAGTRKDQECEACDYPEWLSDVLSQYADNQGATT